MYSYFKPIFLSLRLAFFVTADVDVRRVHYFPQLGLFMDVFHRMFELSGTPPNWSIFIFTVTLLSFSLHTFN